MNSEIRVGSVYHIVMPAITLVGVVSKVSSGTFEAWETTIARHNGEFIGLRLSTRDPNQQGEQHPVFMRDIVEVPAYVGGPMSDIGKIAQDALDKVPPQYKREQGVDHALDTGDAFEQAGNDDIAQIAQITRDAIRKNPTPITDFVFGKEENPRG